MKIVILGFSDYDKLNNTMMKLINENQYFLFTVVCGGQFPAGPSLAEQWAKNNGAPVEYCYNENIEQLINIIATTADYIVADLENGPPHLKRIVMKMKALGKHGMVIR